MKNVTELKSLENLNVDMEQINFKDQLEILQ